MTTISYENENDNAISKCCERFIKRFRINGLLRSSNATKVKGIPAYAVFAFLLGLVFSGKNLYTLLTTSKEKISFGKDVVYRFLSNASINWNLFLFNLSCSVVSEVDYLTSDERRTVLIIDDTPYYRDRSKNVELLSRFKDHSKNNRYYKGFELLTMGWSDGQTFIPVDFRLSANKEDKKLICGTSVKEDNRTLATKRRQDARRSKPDLVLDMLRNVKGTSAEAKYVSFDSWFSAPSAIINIKNLGFDVVARLKSNKMRYEFEGELLTLKEIYARSKKRRGRASWLLSVTVKVRHDNFKEKISAKIVFVRDRNNRKNWIAIISTDTSLSEEEMIELYGKRWDIEPYHKMIKSYLKLEKEFQFRSFDAINAHITIVLTRYILLSLENREKKDLRSINEGFHMLCNELEDISFAQAFDLIKSVIKQCCADYLHLAKEQINAFVELFVVGLPSYIKDKLVFSMCES